MSAEKRESHYFIDDEIIRPGSAAKTIFDITKNYPDIY